MHLQRDNTQSDQGFTLLEVAFVVLLMSILLMIALATFHTTTESANAAACRSNQDALTKAVLIAATAGNPPDAIGDLEQLVQPVAHEQDPETSPAQVADQAEQTLHLPRGQGRGGLVHHQQPGVGGQRGVSTQRGQ